MILTFLFWQNMYSMWEASTERMCRCVNKGWHGEVKFLTWRKRLTVVSGGMPSYVKLTAFSIKTIFKSLILFVLQILAVYWDVRYSKVQSILTWLKKIDSCFQVKIVLDMSSYVKFTAFSIKIIFRSLNSFRFADISSLLRFAIFDILI